MKYKGNSYQIMKVPSNKAFDGRKQRAHQLSRYMPLTITKK